MSTATSVPRLPDPPGVWDPNFLREYNRVLSGWMQQVVSVSNFEKSRRAFQTVTTDTALGPADGFVLADTTAGNVTITLPDATTVMGYEYAVKRATAGANTLTIDTVGGNIDGAASTAIAAQYDYLRFKSDGTDYWIY